MAAPSPAGRRLWGVIVLAFCMFATGRAEPPVAAVHPVHVFLIHGLDPLDLGGLEDLRCFLARQPVASVSLYQFFQPGAVRRGILHQRASDPTCRIAVIGFSAGALTARRLVSTLHEEDGLDVDLLVYLGGGFIDDSDCSRPDYVPEVVHILADTFLFRGGPITGAENYRILGIGHFDSPLHPLTLSVLSDHLRRLWRPAAPLQPAKLPSAPAPSPASSAAPVQPARLLVIDPDEGEVVVSDEPSKPRPALLPPRPMMRQP